MRVLIPVFCLVFGLPTAWAAKKGDCDNQVQPTSILTLHSWRNAGKPLPGGKGSTEAAKSFLQEFLNANYAMLVSALESRGIALGTVDFDALRKLDGPYKWTRKSKTKAKGEMEKSATSIRMFQFEGSDPTLKMEIDVADSKDGMIFISDIRIFTKNKAEAALHFPKIAFPEHLVGNEHPEIKWSLTFPLSPQRPPTRTESTFFKTHLPIAIGSPRGNGKPYTSYVRQLGNIGGPWMRITDEEGRRGWMAVTGNRDANGLIGILYYDGDKNPRSVFEIQPEVRLTIVGVPRPAPPSPTPKRKEVDRPKPAYREHGAARISGAELKKIFEKYSYPKSEMDGGVVERFTHNLSSFNGYETGDEDLIPDFPAYLMGDLERIKIGFDNTEADARYSENSIRRLTGIRTLSNGLTYLGIQVSEDTKVPTFIAIYFDGQDLRLYVPHDGNPYNDFENRAYGMSEVGDGWDTADVKNAEQRFPKEMTGFVNDGNTGMDEVLKFNADQIEADLQRNIPVKD